MSNTEIVPGTARTSEDRLMPAAAYALYFVGLFTGVPIILGAILAYIVRGSAGPAMRTHYTYLIRTFWTAVVCWLVAGLLFAIGIPLSFVLVGIPLVALAWAILAVIHFWILLRLVLGSIYLLRGDAHPRPQALIA